MDEAISKSTSSIIVAGLVATAASVFLIFGFIFGGPILSLIVLIKGWDNTRPLIKIGAIGFGLGSILIIACTTISLIVDFSSYNIEGKVIYSGIILFSIALQGLSFLVLGIAFYNQSRQYERLN